MFGFTCFLRAPKYVSKYEYEIDVNHAVALEANVLRSGIKTIQGDNYEDNDVYPSFNVS